MDSEHGAIRPSRHHHQVHAPLTRKDSVAQSPLHALSSLAPHLGMLISIVCCTDGIACESDQIVPSRLELANLQPM